MALTHDFSATLPTLLSQFDPVDNIDGAVQTSKYSVNPQDAFLGQGLRTAFAQQAAGDLFQRALASEQAGDLVGAAIYKRRAEEAQLQGAAARGNVPTWDQATGGLRSLTLGPMADYVASGVGQGAGSMLPSTMAAMLPLGKLGRYAAAALPAYHMNRGEQVGIQYADPVQAAQSADDRALNASLYAGAAAIPDAIAPASIAARMLPGTRGAAILSGAGPTMAFEGGTEALQNKMSDYASSLLNPEIDPFSTANNAEMMENYRQGVLGAGGMNALTIPGQMVDDAGRASLTAGMDLFNRAKSSDAVQRMKERGIVGTSEDLIDQAFLMGNKAVSEVEAMSNWADQVGWGPVLHAKAHEMTGGNPMVDKLAKYASKLPQSVRIALFGAQGRQKAADIIKNDPGAFRGLVTGLSDEQIDANAKEAADLILNGDIKGTDVNIAAQRVMDGKADKRDVELVLFAGQLHKMGQSDTDNIKNMPEVQEVIQGFQNDPARSMPELVNRIRAAANSASNMYYNFKDMSPALRAEKQDALDAVADMTDQQIIEKLPAIRAMVRGVTETNNRGAAMSALKKLNDLVNEQGAKVGIKTDFSKMTGSQASAPQDFAAGLHRMISEANPQLADEQGVTDRDIKRMVRNVVQFLNMSADSSAPGRTGSADRAEAYEAIRKLAGNKYDSELNDEFLSNLQFNERGVKSLKDSVSSVLNTPARGKKLDKNHKRNIGRAVSLLRTAFSDTKSPKSFKKVTGVVSAYNALADSIAKATGVDRKGIDDALMVLADPALANKIARENFSNKAVVSGSSDAMSIAAVADRMPKIDTSYDGEDTDGGVGDVSVQSAAEAGATGMDNEVHMTDAVSSVNTEDHMLPGGDLIQQMQEMQAKYGQTHDISFSSMLDWADLQLSWKDKRNNEKIEEVLAEQMNKIIAKDKARVDEIRSTYPTVKVGLLLDETQKIWDKYVELYGSTFIQPRHLWQDWATTAKTQRDFLDKQVPQKASLFAAEAGIDRYKVEAIMRELYWINARAGTAQKGSAREFFDRYGHYRIVKATPKQLGIERFSDADIDEATTPLHLRKMDLVSFDEDGNPVSKTPDVPAGFMAIQNSSDGKWVSVDVPQLMSKRFADAEAVTKDDLLHELTSLKIQLSEKFGGEPNLNIDDTSAPLIQSADGKVKLSLGDFVKVAEKNPFNAVELSYENGTLAKDPIQAEYQATLKQLKAAIAQGKDNPKLTAYVTELAKEVKELQQSPDTPAAVMKLGYLKLTPNRKNGKPAYLHVPTFLATALAERGWQGNLAQLSKSTLTGLLLAASKDLEQRGFKPIDFTNFEDPQNPLRLLTVAEGLRAVEGMVTKAPYEKNVTLGSIFKAFESSEYVARAPKGFVPTLAGWATYDLEYVSNKINRYQDWLNAVQKALNATRIGGAYRSDPTAIKKAIAALEAKIDELDEQYMNAGSAPRPKERRAELKAQSDAAQEELRKLQLGEGKVTGVVRSISPEVAAKIDTMLRTDISMLVDDFIEKHFGDQDFSEGIIDLLIHGPDAQKIYDALGREDDVKNDPDTYSAGWMRFLVEYLQSEIDAMKGLVEESYAAEVGGRAEHVKGYVIVKDDTATGAGASVLEGVVPKEMDGITSFEADAEGYSQINHNPLSDPANRPVDGPVLYGDQALLEQFGNKLFGMQNSLIVSTREANGSYSMTAGPALRNPSVVDWQSQPGKVEAMYMLANHELNRLKQYADLEREMKAGGMFTDLADQLFDLLSRLEPLIDPNYSYPNPRYSEKKVDQATADSYIPPLGRSEPSFAQGAQNQRGMNATGGATATPLNPNDASVVYAPVSEAGPTKTNNPVIQKSDYTGDFVSSYSKAKVNPSTLGQQVQGTTDELVAKFSQLMNGLPENKASMFIVPELRDEDGNAVNEQTLFDSETEQHILLLNSALASPGLWQYMYHGSMHALLNSLATSEVANTRKVAEKILRVARAKPMRTKIDKLLREMGEEAEADRIAELPLSDSAAEYAAYMYQFANLHDANGKPMITIGEDTRGVVEAIKRLMAWIFRMTTDAQQVNNFIEAWHKGEVDLGNPHAPITNLQRKYMDEALDNLKESVSPLVEVFSKVFSDSETRMRKMGNTFVNQIADYYLGSRGKRGYEDILHTEAAKMANDLSKTIGGIDTKDTWDALAEVFQGNPQSETAKKIVAWMTTNGMLSSGHPEIVWDMDVIQQNPDAFMHDVNNRNLATVDDLTKSEFDSTANPVVNMLIRNNLIHAGVKTMHDANSIEGMYGIRVHPKAGQFKHLAKYMQHDPSLYFPALLMRHARVKAQERALGTYVPEGSDTPVAKTFDLEALINGVANDKSLTSSQKQEVADFVAMMEGRLGANMSPALRTAQNWALTVANVVTLPLSIFSQLVEPMSIAARSGNLGDAFSAMVTGLASIPSGLAGSTPNTHEFNLAVELGMVERDSVLDNMQYLQNGVHMSGMPHRINKMFFKWNLMEGWHRSMHAAAVGIAERFIIQHRNGEGESGRYLEELGLTKDDIQVDAEGHLVRSPKIDDALIMFVSSAVAVPNKGNTAIWMNDARFALLGHMKRFTFAFHKDVLSRAFDEFKSHKNAVPLAMLLGAIPVALAVGGVKHAIKGVDSSWGDAMLSAVQASSIMGKWDFAGQAMRDVEFGRQAGASMAGPFINLVSDVASGRGI